MFVATSAALIAAVAIVGFILGHRGASSAGRSSNTLTAHTADLAVAVPADWAPASIPSAVTTLALAAPVVRQDPHSRGILLAGRLPDATGALLLPPAFVHALVRVPTRDDPVQLGRTAAYRYQGLSLRPAGPLITLFVTPTRAGVFTTGCVYTAASRASFLSRCERSATTLRLVRATGLPLGPSVAYAATLRLAVGQILGSERMARQLKTVGTPAAQAALCRRLSQQQGAAAALLSGAAPGPDASRANQRLVGYLRSAELGYSAMEEAARAVRRTRYDGARARTESALRGAGETIGYLRSIGYGDRISRT